MATRHNNGSTRYKEKHDRWVRIEVKRALSMLEQFGTVLRDHTAVMAQAKRYIDGGGGL